MVLLAGKAFRTGQTGRCRHAAWPRRTQAGRHGAAGFGGHRRGAALDRVLQDSLNGGEFELQSLKVSGVLDTNVPFFMKGTTYNDTVILCDEAEDLSESQIKLIGTRLRREQ